MQLDCQVIRFTETWEGALSFSLVEFQCDPFMGITRYVLLLCKRESGDIQIGILVSRKGLVPSCYNKLVDLVCVESHLELLIYDYVAAHSLLERLLLDNQSWRGYKGWTLSLYEIRSIWTDYNTAGQIPDDIFGNVTI